jgi:4-hydroxy-tetrahydrodipicolinate reductase
MTEIILTGCNGKMGHSIAETVKSSESFTIEAGVDINNSPCNDFHVYSDINGIENPHGVIVDFSHHTLTPQILDFAVTHSLPVVIATTAHTSEETDKILEASRFIPIFKTANMSLGINLLIELAKKAVEILGSDFDIELIEKHHNQKIDAPSGTALLIADAINDTLTYDAEYTYDRHTRREKRKNEEIGIHSVRGGTIVGEHEVIFAGSDEIVSLYHRADSRRVFVLGALNAAEYIKSKSPGLYDMSMLLKEKLK